VTNRATRWFAARILSEALHPNDANDAPPEALFEETIVLLRARNAREAVRRAHELGAGAEHEYENALGGVVRWVFREVLEVQELLDDEIADGTEVYYTFLDRRQLDERRRALAAKEPEPTRS
jgi:hypothetical protein